MAIKPKTLINLAICNFILILCSPEFQSDQLHTDCKTEKKEHFILSLSYCLNTQDNQIKDKSDNFYHLHFFFILFIL